jgi:hypothetical protein
MLMHISFFFQALNLLQLKVLAFSTTSFHFPRSWTQAVQFLIFIWQISCLMLSSHLYLGLPCDLLVRGFQLNIGCPNTYQTRHFFNNSNTNEDIATKQTHTADTFLFISHTTNVILFKFRCNIFIGVRIIKEIPGLVGSGAPCIFLTVLVSGILCT